MTFNDIICNLKTIKMMKNKRHNIFITAKKTQANQSIS